MQKTNVMVESIKVDPPISLEVIDNVGAKFLIRSQKIHEHYAVNLGTKCTECKDGVSICKHLNVVRKLVDKEVTYLKRILSVEKDRLENNLDDVGKNDIVSPSQALNLILYL